MNIFLSIFVILSWIPVHRAGGCAPYVNSRIQTCVAPVAEYAKVLNGNSQSPSKDFGSAFSLPNMGGRVFNELCKLIAKFNMCVADHRETCPNHVTIALIDSSYGYLCNEGYNTFMESAECLMELDRRPSVKHCHDETLLEIESANSEGGIAIAAKLDRMCGALNFFSGCVRSPIKNECGASAWQVIYRVLKDTTNTLMPKCQFTGTSPRLTTEEPSFTIPPLEETTTELTTTTITVPSTSRPLTQANRKAMRKNINSSGLTQRNVSSPSMYHLTLFIISCYFSFTITLM